MNPSTLPYRISTITITGSVNSEINLDVLYDAINITSHDTNTNGVSYAEYGRKKSEMVHKGFARKLLIQKRKVDKSNRRFDNQVTIVYRLNEIVDNITFNATLNMKVFKNGNIQITGVKYLDQGKKAIDYLISILKEAYKTTDNIVTNIDELCNKDYNVRLINSDFKIGFPIKRELLHNLFIDKYDHHCTYEPCIYPGVKIDYFCNKTFGKHDGLCYCRRQMCKGKGIGKGEEQCKKVTIAVFQSGCVIITGAQDHNQINDAYDFITEVLINNKNSIERKNVAQPILIEAKNKIIYIKKKDIKKNNKFTQQSLAV